MVKRSILTRELLARIQNLRNKEVDKGSEILMKYKVNPSKLPAIKIGYMKVDELSEAELLYLTLTINELRDKVLNSYTEINISDFYSEKEVATLIAIEEKEEKCKYPYIISNILEVDYNQWTTVLSAKQLAEMYEMQLISYNFDTQRMAITKEASGEEFYIINVNKSSIKDIKKGLLNETFISNAITFNINIDLNGNEYEYNAGKKELTLNSGTLDIIDGFHRYRSIIYAYLEKRDKDGEELNFKVTCMIKAFDTVKARSYIAQEDKRNPLGRNYAKALEANYENFVSVRLNEDAMSLLYGKIHPNMNHTIHPVDMSLMIKAYYKVTNNVEVIATKKKIDKMFNTLIEQNEDALDRKISMKKLAIIFEAWDWCNKNNCINCFGEIVNETVNRISSIEGIFNSSSYNAKMRWNVENAIKAVAEGLMGEGLVE